MSSTTVVQKDHAPEDDGYADRGNTATLARLTPEQASHYFHDTTVWGEDGRIREGTPEELAAEYAEVSQYFVRPMPVLEQTDAAILVNDWQPGDPVSAVLGDPLGENVDLFDVQDDW